MLMPHGRGWGQTPAELFKNPEPGKPSASGEKDKQIEELKRQLREKDAELARLREKLEQQIEALKQQLQVVKGQSGTQSQQTEALQQQLRAKEAELAALKQQPTPDTVKKQLGEKDKQIVDLKQQLRAKEKALGTPEKTSPPTPREWRSPLGIEFVLIQPESFIMGSTMRGDDEKPLHRVTISKPFYLGKYEVTQGQWLAVMGSNLSKFTDDPQLPVENVSWDDVQEFIRKLNTREGGRGYEYRLPSEAQWEYAARAGSPMAYSFGDNTSQFGDYAWYGANAGRKTHPVGQKLPNAWGLYDMHGNVWEWVQDWYGAYAAAAVSDPTGPASGSIRVLRGGGWTNGAAFCASAHRCGEGPGNRRSYLGFRLLRTVP
jgi:formylglycine-generating enzyme required for sulfatase activity